MYFLCMNCSAALVCLAEMEFLSTRSYFMKTISEKKYALPHLAIDAVAAHFLRFRRETKVMPVIWYQTLLAFVQRYSHELRKEDKKSLTSLLEKQNHELITPDIVL
uniref:Bystin n=1 Tax=Brassica oleracea var. oleracea TaxID=109376 RepID=A0A0D3E959_BRAOL